MYISGKMEFLILKWGWGIKVQPLCLLSIPTQDGPAGGSGKPWVFCHLHIKEAHTRDEIAPQQVSRLRSGLIDLKWHSCFFLSWLVLFTISLFWLTILLLSYSSKFEVLHESFFVFISRFFQSSSYWLCCLSSCCYNSSSDYITSPLYCNTLYYNLLFGLVTHSVLSFCFPSIMHIKFSKMLTSSLLQSVQ